MTSAFGRSGFRVCSWNCVYVNWVDDDRWKIAVIHRQRRRPCCALINLHPRPQQYLITWQPVSCCTTPVCYSVRYTRITWHLRRRTNSGDYSVCVSVSIPPRTLIWADATANRRILPHFMQSVKFEYLHWHLHKCVLWRDVCLPFFSIKSVPVSKNFHNGGVYEGCLIFLWCFRTIPKISIFGYEYHITLEEDVLRRLSFAFHRACTKLTVVMTMKRPACRG